MLHQQLYDKTIKWNINKNNENNYLSKFIGTSWNGGSNNGVCCIWYQLCVCWINYTLWELTLKQENIDLVELLIFGYIGAVYEVQKNGSTITVNQQSVEMLRFYILWLFCSTISTTIDNTYHKIMINNNNKYREGNITCHRDS